MSASFFGWPGILLGDGAWRRDCGMGPEDVLIRLRLRLSVCQSMMWRLESISLTFAQSGENLTEGDVRVACACGEGSGVVGSIFREGIRKIGLVT